MTHTATGVSGVTNASPAITVARETGRLLYSVFDKAGFQIMALPAERAQGEPLSTDDTRRVAELTDGNGNGPDTVKARTVPRSAAVLPSDGAASPHVAAYLADTDAGLPTSATFEDKAYRTAFRLAGIEPVDRRGNEQPARHAVLRRRVRVLQRHARQPDDRCCRTGVRSTARHRRAVPLPQQRSALELGVNVSRVRVRNGAYTNTGAEYVIQHIAVDNASLIVQYPFSHTRRLEFSTGYTHYGYSLESVTQGFDGRSSSVDLPAPSSLGLMQGSIALVGDASAFGFTSPIAGSRYRIEYTPTLGTLSYNTLLADYRKYFFAKPFTLAVRGMPYRLYGKDAERPHGRAVPGDGSLVRGYSYSSFSNADCVSTARANWLEARVRSSTVSWGVVSRW